MNESSAQMYLVFYLNMRTGKLPTRDINLEAIDYFLKSIHQSESVEVFELALNVLKEHIDYCDRNHKHPKGKQKLYQKFLSYSDSIELNFDEVVFKSSDKQSEKAYFEGAQKAILINAYERDRRARAVCLAHHGHVCQVCGFDFEKHYGDIGVGFIHVHHKTELALIGREYRVDPIEDLVPVCPNCHAMLHRRQPAYSVSELKAMLLATHNQ